jgi:RNA polymerase sigma-70 factor (ECF subfamily)
MLKITWKNDDRSDEELLKRYIGSGDLDVLGELYRRYMHLVYGVSLKYLKSRTEAQDAVMQIFEELVTGVTKHKIRNFKSWLYVVTKNYCLMYLRAVQTRSKKMEYYKYEQEFMESDLEPHPIDRDDGSIESALKDCIAALKREQRECIELFYYEGLCYGDIATKLSLEEKKVKSFLQNGKRNLKICLEKKDVR